MTTYNGFPSRAAWNVSLWVNNDEGLYRLALAHLRQSRARRNGERALYAAARFMLSDLEAAGIKRTPDGFPYSVRSLVLVMRDMD